MARRHVPASAALDSDLQQSAQAFGQLVLHRHLHLWRSQIGDLHRRHEPVSLHQWRVTARRLIAVLRWLEAAGCRGARRLRRGVQTLLRGTSALRDLDVQLAQLQDCNASLPRGGLGGVLRDQRREREGLRRELMHRLAAPPAQRLMNGLQALATRPVSRRSVPLAQVASQVLRQRRRVLRRRARRVRVEPAVSTCHALRLATKALRYGVEPLLPLYGSPLRTVLRRLQRLQTVLGQINDAYHEIVCIDSLLQTRPPRALPARRALQNLRAVLERTLQQSLQRVGHACKAVHGRPWRRLHVLMAQAEAQTQA